MISAHIEINHPLEIKNADKDDLVCSRRAIITISLPVNSKRDSYYINCSALDFEAVLAAIHARIEPVRWFGPTEELGSTVSKHRSQ